MSYNGDLYAQAEEVITTKGDLRRGDASGNPERYGIGSTNQILSVSSGNILWKTLTTADSVLTTQGDVLYENASGLARLGFGTSGDVLTTKGTGANPVWETPSASGANTALSNLSSVSVNAEIDMNTNDLTNIQFLQLKAHLEITINATGVITVTQSFHSVDTFEDASTDDCGTLDGSTPGQIIVLRSQEDARDPTFVDSAGSNPKMELAGNFTCDTNADKLTLLSTVSSANYEVDELSRSDNL